MNTISVRFDVLHAYAKKHNLDWNELCRMVRDAIAEGSAVAQSHRACGNCYGIVCDCIGGKA